MTRKEFTYLSAETSAQLADELTRHGADGWCLLTILPGIDARPNTTGATAYMERLALDDQDAE